ncbi:MAG TPA: ribulose-phosphate 3-epimerase [Candidatus Limnocylindria bacterium]|nr:ribulose-phosphate 3-epimerase [Candidatus Limnocylindria bacterium]
MDRIVSASMMCADLLDLRRGIRELEEVGTDWLHCDVMDGHFVPNWMMFPDLVNALAEETRLPLDVHLMVDDPLFLLPRLKLRPGDVVTVSLESTVHAQRALAAVRDTGATPGLALNPGTPLSAMEELLPDFSLLLLMTVNPGYAGQRMVPQSIAKIERARAMLDAAGFPGTRIEADGNCSFANVPLMVQAGADVIVAGTSSLFMQGLTLKEGMERLRRAMA